MCVRWGPAGAFANQLDGRKSPKAAVRVRQLSLRVAALLRRRHRTIPISGMLQLALLRLDLGSLRLDQGPTIPSAPRMTPFGIAFERRKSDEGHSRFHQ